MKMKIKKAISDERVSYIEFSNALENANIGFWDSVNSTEIIKEYIIEKIKRDVCL